MWLIPLGGTLILVLIVVVILSRPISIPRARRRFAVQRPALEQAFRTSAAASGKPRGLTWLDLDWDPNVLFARERATGQLAALVGVTVRFAAIPGSDMEDLPAVANPRIATAVFFFHRGQWHTTGRTLFNLDPNEAVRHLANQYELLTS
jgi:hypothetical protein